MHSSSSSTKAISSRPSRQDASNTSSCCLRNSKATQTEMVGSAAGPDSCMSWRPQTAEQKEKERRSSKRWSAAEIEQLIAGTRLLQLCAYAERPFRSNPDLMCTTGVELFNFGHWAAIKQHYGFDLRTPVDLKDKWCDVRAAAQHPACRLLSSLRWNNLVQAEPGKCCATQ